MESQARRQDFTQQKIKSTSVFHLPMDIAVQLLWYLKCVATKYLDEFNRQVIQVDHMGLIEIENLHIRKGVNKVLQVIRGKADLIKQDMIVRWPRSSLFMESKAKIK